MSEEEKQQNKEEAEARQNLSAFFDLALKVALREGIDIGQFENYQNNKENYDRYSDNGN